ncbi:MAG: CPBP family intramembrane metalloprotease [Acidimicrobiia bacterium]|nr:CPBP family intramembrane metalloprotease [Acidimicrobiia bacterium]
MFDDERVSPDDVAYQMLVRIPLGTVVLEEVAFRAVLPVLLDGIERSTPSVSSAVLFGLWHVLPTLNTLDINEVADPTSRVKAVGGGVGATAVVGWLFDWLRLRTGSVTAPMLVHWSANAVSYAIAAHRRPTRTRLSS